MEDKTTFTSEELVANDLAFKSLVELIQAEDAIAMVGAGCSGGLFPAWGDFVDRLEAYSLEIDPDFKADKAEFLPFADKVKECLGNERYYDFIYNTFKPQDPTHFSFHEIFCRLPFKAITTTNYDVVLEHALTIVTKKPFSSLHFEGTTKTKIHDFLKSLNYNKSSRKYIVHLHGIYDSFDSIVLGGNEYSSKYGFELGENDDTLFDQLQNGELSREKLTDLLVKYGYEWPLRRKLLWSLLATRRIVFIGFSMSDPYFIRMLDFVKNDLSTYNAETHFLVLRVTPSNLQRSVEHAQHLKREYGIQTVFFQDEEGKYTGLGQFISTLENAVNINPEVDIPKAVEVAEAVSAGNKALTDKLFSISKKQYTNEN